MSDAAPLKVKLAEVARAEADQRIVGHLERLLEQAKSGELTGFAYAMVLRDGGKPDGAYNTGMYVGPFCNYAMTHAIRALSLRWDREELERG